MSLLPFVAYSAGRDDAKSDDWYAEPSECNKIIIAKLMSGYNTEPVYTMIELRFGDMDLSLYNISPEGRVVPRPKPYGFTSQHNYSKSFAKINGFVLITHSHFLIHPPLQSQPSFPRP